MRASSRRSHHASRPSMPRAQHDALAPRARSSSGSSLDTTGPSASEPPAQDRLRVARRLGREPAVAVAHDAPAARAARRATRCHGRGLLGRHVAHPEERLVHLLGVLRLRPGLLAHARDGLGVERAELVGGPRVEHAARHDGLRAALLERRVVEERVGLRVQDAAREGRRLGRVDRARSMRAVAQAAQDLEEAVDVHRLGEAVLDRLAHDRVLHRHLDVAAAAASRGRRRPAGKAAASRSSARMRRSGAGTRLPFRRALEQQRARDVPAPARLEHRRGQQRLDEHARAPCPGAGSRRPPPAGSCAAGRARARSPPRSRPPAARSRSRGRSACAAPGPRRG